MSTPQPAFYASTGSRGRDLVALLHLPYTGWHLSYVVIGAAMAPDVDGLRLAGTLAAFFIGLGIGAHALDEVHGRPLGTGLSRATLWALGVGAMATSLAIAGIGAVVVSPWVPVWGVAGVVISSAYALEWWPALHSNLGFGLAWGAFPVITGYWVQAESISAAVLVVAVAATLLSLAQRALSTPARFVRRKTEQAEAAFDDERWDRHRLLGTWELPLRLLAGAIMVLAVGLLLSRL